MDDPKKIINDTLKNVSARSRFQNVLEFTATGLFFSGLMLLLFFGTFYAMEWKIVAPWLLGGLAAGIGVLTGLLAGLLEPVGPVAAARKVDAHYGFKNRLLTALKSISLTETTPMERLQLDDAATHAAKVDPETVQPYRLPRDFFKAIAISVSGTIVCFLLSSTHLPHGLQAAQPNKTVLEILGQLEEELAAPLEALAAENSDDPTIKNLHEKIVGLMRRIEENKSEPTESLATLTLMEKAISQAIGEFDIEAMDASLREFGQALENAEATRPAAKAFKEADYTKAAEELEKLDPGTMSQRERNTVGDELRKASDSMERRKQAQLAKLTRKLSEEIKKNDCAGCKNTTCQFAGTCRKQCSRKGMCDKLNCQLAKLGQCKSQCAGACSSCPNKGQCASQQSQGLGEAAVTQNGLGQAPGQQIAADPRTGQETNLDSLREKKIATGIRGEGSSEVETESSAQYAEEKGTRSFEKQYHEFRKQAESLLESEPIPLEQRRVIRRYFESIRPNDSETPSPTAGRSIRR